MAVPEAMEFYNLLLRQQQDRTAYYVAKNLSASVSISTDWVCFAAYLLDDRGRGVTTGPDLEKHEVKSVVGRGGFEYQYHRDSWKEKLIDDREVNHVFIARSPDLLNITVRIATGERVHEVFLTRWQTELDGYYERNPTVQRFRRSIPHAWPESNADIKMRITGGKPRLIGP